MQSQGDLAREIEAFNEDWLAPTLREFVEKMGERVAELNPDLDEIKARAPDVPGGVLLDLLIEGGVLVLLNLVLPGEWLVAVVARVLGKHGLDKALEPIRHMVRDLVKQVLGGFLRSRMEDAIRNSILEAGPDLVEQVNAQIVTLLSEVEDRLVAEIETKISDSVSAAEKARDELEQGVAHATAEEARLREVALRVRSFAKHWAEES